MQDNRKFRDILPKPIAEMLGKARMEFRNWRLSNLSTAEAFNQIYSKRMWRQGSSLSGPGSEGQLASDYVKVVKNYIDRHRVENVLDIGCGDFVVGSQLCGSVKNYIAADISSVIIEANRALYQKAGNVQFVTINAIEHELPTVDLCLIREVLQHLTNDQIEAILRNVERSGTKRLLVAEHVPSACMGSEANRDLRSHSVYTRAKYNSGVDIGLPPFNRKREILASITPSHENLSADNSVLQIYELTL